jgi:hypothetical protein
MLFPVPAWLIVVQAASPKPITDRPRIPADRWLNRFPLRLALSALAVDAHVAVVSCLTYVAGVSRAADEGSYDRRVGANHGSCQGDLVCWMLIAGQRHLRAVLDEYVVHYNQHRPHRARNLRPPDAEDTATAPVTDLAVARIRRRKVLGGLIHEYRRAA